MNQRAFEKNFRQELGRSLGQIGFSEERPLAFARSFFDRKELLLFHVRSNGGRYFVSCHTGIRFIAVEEMRRSGSDSLLPTILMPIHLLRESRIFSEWIFECCNVHGSVIGEIVIDIRGLVLPFFQRFSTLTSLREILGSPDPTEWFVLNPEQRIELLAVVLCLEGQVDQAFALIDDALVARRDDPPKKRRPLEKARKILVENMKIS